MITGRTCTQCRVDQPASAFVWKDGKKRLGARCRDCRLANYKENPERAKARSREWYASHREQVIRRDREYRRTSVDRILLSSARKRAKDLGLPFDLTLADIVVPDRCPVLGMPLVVNEGRSRPDSPSLDRVVPALGYVRGNVMVISHRANTIKSDASIAELIRVASFYAQLDGSALAVAVTWHDTDGRISR